MDNHNSRRFSRVAGVYYERYLPEKGAQLAGYIDLHNANELLAINGKVEISLCAYTPSSDTPLFSHTSKCLNLHNNMHY